jgi:hypothetical protein
MPACGTPGRKRGHHREPVDPTIALTHTVDAIRILRPAVMAALGHSLPSAIACDERLLRVKKAASGLLAGPMSSDYFR